VAEHRGVPQPWFHLRAVTQDPAGQGRHRLGVPVPGYLGATEDDGVTVREQVDQLVPVAGQADEELGEAGVGGDDGLAAPGGEFRVGGQAAGVHTGAVHHGAHRQASRGGGQRADGGQFQGAARALQPGPQVLQVGRHVGERGGVVPAAAEARRQGIGLAPPRTAEFGQPAGRRAGLRFAAGGLDAAGDPHPGGRVGGQFAEHGQGLAAPAGRALAVFHQVRAPDGARHRGGGARRRPVGPDQHGQSLLGEADRGGQADHAGPYH